MWQGTAVPDARFYDAISQVTGVDLGTLLVEGGVLTPESLQSLSGTGRSQVESGLTPEEAADRLGFRDEVTRELFYASVERLKRADEQRTDGPNPGEATAQM